MRLALVALIVISPLPVKALTVTLNPSTDTSLNAVMIYDGGGVPERPRSDLYPEGLPYSDAQAVGGSHSTSSAAYSLDATGFEISFEHATGDLDAAWAQSWGHLYFTVDEDVAYVISGEYSATDPGGFQVSQDAYLIDQTTGSYLFLGAQNSNETANETLVLGLQQGDDHNELQGFLSGMLIAGHVYEFEYNNRLYTLSNADMPPRASAIGSVRLTFVPEPSSGSLVSLGLAAVSLVRRYRSA